MMKLVVLFVLVAISEADIVSRQRAVIPHHSKFGYGDGISSRYFDKVEATGHYGLKYDDGLKYGYGPAYDLRYDGYGAGLGYGYGPAYGLNYGGLKYGYGPARGLNYGAGLKYGYGPARGLNYGAGLKYGYGPANGLKYGGYGAGLGLGYNLGYGGYGWAYPGVYTAVTV